MAYNLFTLLQGNLTDLIAYIRYFRLDTLKYFSDLTFRSPIIKERHVDMYLRFMSKKYN